MDSVLFFVVNQSADIIRANNLRYKISEASHLNYVVSASKEKSVVLNQMKLMT